MMPNISEVAVLRAARLGEIGATFRLDDGQVRQCMARGWLSPEGKLTAAGRQVLLEETAGGD